MQDARNYVMTVAGLDPSGGAGILADIKTFEQHRVYGLSVCTASTLQTADTFHAIRWTPLHEVLRDIDTLMEAYPINVVKTGIVPSFQYLSEIIHLIKKKNPTAKIVVDPVLRSSTGFTFVTPGEKTKLEKLLRLVYLLTPNAHEVQVLTEDVDSIRGAQQLSRYCNVLLKGGHLDDAHHFVDHLFIKGEAHAITGSNKKTSAKHGSGCVLSAAIAANLTRGLSLAQSCFEGKAYTEKFLSSNTSLLGYHYA
ncbi:hydroxymethylpyrimidine/phosphomethylpyrimidine kinase [Pseudochryseolinea flava]|uniref:hydroxymethylpyrimidine kinase n=1 Tax=Pseudochryseolinea flava TaxID=2059302 RepID=A0A364XXN0_9BACT|nr:hydroxymethylpyrimidine/phosphomethylpyrimidine kinase [Pseudochryseolinea flava]RAV99013.1 hydroxymethylpyrimidine/phosphomethylpyrimidine kinase [Pseudochryseolinea flava]